MIIDFNCQQKPSAKCLIRILKALIVWSFYVISYFFLDRRFLPLSPPIFERQYFYDGLRKEVVLVKIRNWVDWQTCRQIFYQEDYGISSLTRKESILKLYIDIIKSKKKPLILDCGANIGLAANYFSLTYEGSEVFAIEPETNNFLQAQINKRLGCKIFQGAVGSENGRVNLIDPNLGDSGYRVQANHDGDVDLISINSILKKYESDEYVPFFIKIDIEGFESELFSKNTEWLTKFPVIFIELHDWMLPKTGNSNNFLKEISKLNNDFIYLGENVISISNSLID